MEEREYTPGMLDKVSKARKKKKRLIEGRANISYPISPYSFARSRVVVNGDYGGEKVNDG